MLAQRTTLRLGGPARETVVADSEAELIEAVRSADDAGESVLLIAGGSNLVVADEGFAGRVVIVNTRGVSSDHDSADPTCGGVLVTIQAGELWDAVVARAVTNNWVGIEALSGIPGAVGATPIQNVGAYGQEVAQTIASVRTWDRQTQQQRTFAAAECSFAYRDSLFKQLPMRYLVLEVTFQLAIGPLSAPIEYAELARALGVDVGERAPLAAVRREVLRLRAGKGMVLDSADHDTWSAGSFFTNPILSAAEAARLPEDAPRFEQPDGNVKTSAAWLIDHAGFAKGHPGAQGRVSLSTKHVLALTNRGNASTADLLALALEVRDGVQLAFGITLRPEPTLIGCRLP